MGYGIKIFVPMPLHYVTRLPGSFLAKWKTSLLTKSYKRGLNLELYLSVDDVSHRLTNAIHLTLKMTPAQVVETSVTNNSSFQNYPHPDDHTIPTTDTPGFKSFTMLPVKYQVSFRENFISSHVKITCYLRTWRDMECVPTFCSASFKYLWL